MLRGAETALIDKQAELAKLNHDLSDKSMVAETRQVELVTVRAQIDALQARVGDAEKEFSETQARLEQQRGQSDAATRELAEARERVENLSHRVTDLDRQLMLQVKEAEMLNGRITDLENALRRRATTRRANMRTSSCARQPKRGRTERNCATRSRH